jgi:hypothetical protein
MFRLDALVILRANIKLFIENLRYVYHMQIATVTVNGVSSSLTVKLLLFFVYAHMIITTEENPAIDLDTGELVEIAASVGTPVSAFLMQDEITDVIPDSVKVPTGEPYGSAAAMVAVSMTILLMGTVASLFFN